jgi:hypothetical protein
MKRKTMEKMKEELNIDTEILKKIPICVSGKERLNKPNKSLV